MARVSTETLTVGILSLLFALVGAYLLRQYLQRESPPPPPRRTRVPLSALDLPSGKRVAIGDIILVPMTDQQMRDRKFPLDYLMLNARQIVGRTLRESQEGGGPFLINKFYPVGMGPNLYDRLKPGYRAVTITVSGNGAIAGQVGSGNLVDILFFPERATNGVPRRLYTILEAVEVLAVSGGGSGGDRNVTVSVTPEDAMSLRIIENGGELSLMLRNPEEPMLALMRKGKTFREALGFAEPEKKPRPIIQRFTTQIYRGGSRSDNRFAFGQRAADGVGDLLPSLNEPGPELPGEFENPIEGEDTPDAAELLKDALDAVEADDSSNDDTTIYIERTTNPLGNNPLGNNPLLQPESKPAADKEPKSSLPDLGALYR